jgi:hypothetical protein
MVQGISPAFKGLEITKPWLRTRVAWTLAVPVRLAKMGSFQRDLCEVPSHD